MHIMRGIHAMGGKILCVLRAPAQDESKVKPQLASGTAPLGDHSGMKVLVACEFSGFVSMGFLLKGHDVMSCDFLPTELPPMKRYRHVRCDVLDIMGNNDFDLMLAFPPCTHLCSSGARWFKDKTEEQRDALQFVRDLMEAPITKIAIENPIGVISTKIRKPDQIIQPWMFGHGETKATCLWLKNLPKLTPTNIVDGREARIHKMAPSKDRGKERSRTYPGIAKAMAEQWGAWDV